jgi:hypothetical protein
VTTPHASTRNLAGALKRQVQQVGQETPSVRGGDFRQGVVATIGTDGTVTTTDGIVVRRMESYPMPVIGDLIRIDQSSAGGWTTPGRLVAPTGDGWRALTMIGTWVANGGLSDPTPMARITPDGMLELSGMVKGTAVNASANANIATVPASMIPTWWIRGVAPTSVTLNYARIGIDPVAGTLQLTNGSVALLAASWVQLDSIRGRAR